MLTMTKLSPPPCRYCEIIANGPREHAFWNRPLLESDNFMVIPTIGSIVEGWLLIVSKQHHINMGAVPASHINELKGIVDHVKEVVTAKYSTPIIFEHGPASCGTTVGCGIDHAHLHVVPLDLSFNVADEDHSFEILNCPKSVHPFDYMRNLYEQKKAYLFLHEPSHDPIFLTSNSIPSQFFRRVIARKVNKYELFDYNKHLFLGNVEGSISKLQSQLVSSNAY